MLHNKKIAIIPDTNIYDPNPNTPYDLTDLPLKKYYKLIEHIEKLNLEDKVDILFPEVVLLELLFHHKEKFKNNIDGLKKIKECFININISITGFENLDFDKNYEQLKDKYFNTLKIIPIPSNKEELIYEILHRYYNKVLPFEENNDKGFKDTIIFLSILYFAKNNSYEKYILFSDDKIFKNNNKKKLKNEFNQSIKEFPFQEDKFEIENKKDIKSYINEKFKMYNELKEYIFNEFNKKITTHYENQKKIEIDGVEYNINRFNIIEEKTIINQIKNEFEVEIIIEFDCNSPNCKKEINKQYTFKKEENKWKYELNKV